MVAPRKANPTVKFIDDYCQAYQNLFPEVRSFEALKNIQIGMISDIKRKTLPASADLVGLPNAQGLHHFRNELSLGSCSLQKETVRVNFSSITR